MLAAPPDPDTITAFIRDVAPMVRDRVAEQRASARREPEHDGGRLRGPPGDHPRALAHRRCSPSTHIRGELASVERLATAVLDGLAAEELREELVALKSNTTLWQFQVSCLRYCQLVHLHHNAEDREFFDELEQVNPALSPVVDRLRADHRAVCPTTST